MSISYTIEAKDLHKSYGKFEAVRGISFHVPAKSCLVYWAIMEQEKRRP